MWWKLKSSYVVEALANLILNIVLGKVWGITGVVLATIITIFLFNYLQRNKILFKSYFKHQSLTEFYKQQFYYLLLTAASLMSAYLICVNLSFGGTLDMILRAIVCLVLSVLIYGLGIRFTSTYDETCKFMSKLIKKGRK